MNCQLCQKEMDAYRDGKLPCDMMTLVESHLISCETCSEIYRLQLLAYKVMDQEKELQPTPFLATRVMAYIVNLEDSEYKPVTVITRVLKHILVTTSIAAAILCGIYLGNLSRSITVSKNIPVELALVDDATLESINILTNE